MVPRERIGLPTPAFSGPRSTTELSRRISIFNAKDYTTTCLLRQIIIACLSALRPLKDLLDFFLGEYTDKTKY